jgi:hypothetical protein
LWDYPISRMYVDNRIAGFMLELMKL